MTANPALTYAPCSSCGAINRVRLQEADGKTPVCSKCHKALPVHGAVVDVPGNHLQRLTGASHLPVIVDCWASWCGPCVAFAPVFEKTAEQMAGRAVFAKLDTQRYANEAGALGIRGIPTLIAYKDGREFTRLSGAMPAAEFKRWLQETVGI